MLKLYLILHITQNILGDSIEIAKEIHARWRNRVKEPDAERKKRRIKRDEQFEQMT